ncbi:hypothetical protein CC80DRAFT_584856 [Byssothecium circinans]|uniref:Uncharacterized protein n=1 Tax=Byssothecium circinans TaxID=147558 RepID=A0A6A5T9X6_9PLEO|nr:hypothetical protein CC80DRAFT_584856 [Byssothecium circinans]
MHRRQPKAKKNTIALCHDTKQRTGVRAGCTALRNLPKSQPCIGSYKPVVLMMLREALTNEFGEAIAYRAGYEHGIERSRTVDRWRSEDRRFILLASVTAFAESITLVEADMVVLG